MKVAFVLILTLSLMHVSFSKRPIPTAPLLSADRRPKTTAAPFLNSSTTEEACTCCPGTPPLVYDEATKVIEVNKIKEQLKVNLDNLDKEFNAAKQKIREKIKKLDDEAEPLKVKLREVRKVNRDKEEELNIEEMTEKSLELRNKFESLADKLAELSELRSETKGEYRELKETCRVKKGDDDYDEESCKEQLSSKLQEIDQANAEVSNAIVEMNQIDEEILAIEAQLKSAEEEFLTAIYQNRDTVKDEIVKMDEIYMQTSGWNKELKKLGKKYVEDQKNLKNIANGKVEKIAPSKEFKWVWMCTKDKLPDKAVVAGHDVDRKSLYIIRGNKREIKEHGFWYGKFSPSLKLAVVFQDYNEHEIFCFDILTGNFNWCERDGEEPNYDYPICRVPHQNTLIPGHMLNGGACLIGFGGRTFTKDSNVERIALGSC